jgi:hypothetical protein
MPKVERITASVLKSRHEACNADSFFFDRKSMKFFGDTMANYYVPAASVRVRRSCGTIVECYELQRRKPVKHSLASSAYFCIHSYARIIGEIV